MAGTLQNIRDLRAFIESVQSDVSGAGAYGITKAMLLSLISQLADAVESNSGVAAAMWSKNSEGAPLTIAGGWNRMDVCTNGRSTRGVFDGLDDATDAGSWFDVRRAGAGDYVVTAKLRFSVDTAGEYEVRVASFTDGGSYSGVGPEDAAMADAGDQIVMALGGVLVKNVTRDQDDNPTDDRLCLQMRGPNGAVVTPVAVEIFATRI